MLRQVAVGQWSLDSYEGVVPEAILDKLREHARALRGVRILQLNATAYGAVSQSCCARRCRCCAISACASTGR